MSKTNFAIYFLDYFYHTTLTKRFLTFMESNVSTKFLYLTLKLRKKNYIKTTELYMADFYYFMTSLWCLMAFKILEFTELHPSVFRLKPYKKKNFGPKGALIHFSNRYLS